MQMFTCLKFYTRFTKFEILLSTFFGFCRAIYFFSKFEILIKVQLVQRNGYNFHRCCTFFEGLNYKLIGFNVYSCVQRFTILNKATRMLRSFGNPICSPEPNTGKMLPLFENRDFGWIANFSFASRESKHHVCYSKADAGIFSKFGFGSNSKIKIPDFRHQFSPTAIPIPSEFGSQAAKGCLPEGLTVCSRMASKWGGSRQIAPMKKWSRKRLARLTAIKSC